MAFGSLVLVPLIAGGFVIQSHVAGDSDLVFQEVMKLVNEKFVYMLDASSLYEKAAQGLVHELNDPYTELYTPKRANEFQRRTGGRYGGIGMEIGELEGGVAVIHVFPHTPAEEAGVMEGDHITQIEAALTRGWKLGQVSDSLLGKPNTKVTVKFERLVVLRHRSSTASRARSFMSRRSPFAIMLDNKIADVPLAQFNEDASEDLEASLRRLVMAEGAKGVILDLRDDPGGILDQAFAVSNVFLKEGDEVVSVRGRGSPTQTFVAKDKPLLASTPMIVLQNGGSASAFRRSSRARSRTTTAHYFFLGTTSFGKGLVDVVPARWRVCAQDDDRQVVHAERPVHSEGAQAPA